MLERTKTFTVHPVDGDGWNYEDATYTQGWFTHTDKPSLDKSYVLELAKEKAEDYARKNSKEARVAVVKDKNTREKIIRYDGKCLNNTSKEDSECVRVSNF